MHDKQIRRRRAVLALLVALSLILLTEAFGASSSSPLHSVQQGVAEVLSPIQDGASKVFSPVRDIAGWVSSTIDAKSQVAELQRANAKLSTEVAHGQYAELQYEQDQKLLRLDTSLGISQYSPVTANVESKNPIVWFDTITVGKGSDSGISQYDPVVGEGGLVGDVSAVGPDYAVITLITSPKIGGVGAIVENGSGSQGVLQPTVGETSALTLNFLPTGAQIAFGDEVVTSGFKDSANPQVQSLYPAGIPIGTVSNENPQETVQDSGQVQVHPAVALQHLSVVQILRRPHGNG